MFGSPGRVGRSLDSAWTASSCFEALAMVQAVAASMPFNNSLLIERLRNLDGSGRMRSGFSLNYQFIQCDRFRLEGPATGVLDGITSLGYFLDQDRGF
jgi:hypothetical protein